MQQRYLNVIPFTLVLCAYIEIEAIYKLIGQRLHMC